VIAGNDIYWNNFNFYYSAPFEIPESSAAGLPYPIGVGVLLFGSRNTTVEGNRFFGNYLGAFAAIPAVQLQGSSDPDLREAAVLRGNTVRNNEFGLGGEDLNGRDMVYDGSGTGNCFSGNSGPGGAGHGDQLGGGRQRRQPGQLRGRVDQASAQAAKGRRAAGALDEVEPEEAAWRAVAPGGSSSTKGKRSAQEAPRRRSRSRRVGAAARRHL
jgi:hypothetical protein